MLQQVLAILIIAYFISRLFWQKKKKQIGAGEFVFWLLFWFLAATAILSLKWIDKLVANLGFSGNGIEILFYIAVIMLFYLVFKLRLKVEKIEKNTTKIVRKIAQEEIKD